MQGKGSKLTSSMWMGVDDKPRGSERVFVRGVVVQQQPPSTERDRTWSREPARDKDCSKSSHGQGSILLAIKIDLASGQGLSCLGKGRQKKKAQLRTLLLISGQPELRAKAKFQACFLPSCGVVSNVSPSIYLLPRKIKGRLVRISSRGQEGPRKEGVEQERAVRGGC